MTDRRGFLCAALLATAGAGTALARAPLGAAASRLQRPRFTSDPFALGVASGYPLADGVVLWTRLAPNPTLIDDDLGTDDIEVGFEIADDPGFTRLLRVGRTRAEALHAHSVHLELRGLPSGREFFYRFRAGDFTSAVGRSWTAPARGMTAERLRIALASCQHYEQGYYHAYRDMLARGTDLIVHVGDYIYEGNTERPVRQHDRGECRTLAAYRLRHAWYRTDPMLQAAHAACPWMLTHDDHEVDNDYAADQAEDPADQDGFRARRTAAYRAYWEHMPLPRSALPRGADMQLYMSRSVGSLLALHMLDERQYRSPQACSTPPRRGGSRVYLDTCPQWHDESRTLLGERQERWLDRGLRGSTARWNLIAQGVVMTQLDEDPGPRERYWNDAWAGYPAARRRLLESIGRSGCANPLVLGGDIHAFIVADQRMRPTDMASPIVTSELVTTSVSSGPPPQRVIEAYNRGDSPDVLLADGAHRGYLHLTVTQQRLEAGLVGFDSVRELQAESRVLARFAIEDGRRGLQRA
jgi:alkaline phosphatase D